MKNLLLSTILRRVLLGLLLIVGAGVVIAAVERKQTSKVKPGIEVTINPLPDGRELFQDSMIRNVLERSFGYPLENRPLAGVNIERAERVLERNPFILNADVYLDANDRMHIEVDQREPVLRIIANNGLNYYLDIEGNKMPLSNVYAPHLLVATGSIPPHVPDFMDADKKHLLADVFKLADVIRADEVLNALVEQIYVANNGEITLIPKVGKQKIRLGKFADVDEKLWRLKVFYQEAMPYRGWRKYKTIDLRYGGQIVAK